MIPTIKKFLMHRLFDFILAGNTGSNQLSIYEKIEYAIKSIITSAPIAFILGGLGIWFDNNVKFFSFMIILVIISMITGGWMHRKKGSWNLETLLVKTGTMVMVIIFSYTVLEFIVQILGTEDTAGILFQKTIQIATILYPGTKILKNAFILSDGKYPPEFIMNKIYNFQKNGDLKQFMEAQREL